MPRPGDDNPTSDSENSFELGYGPVMDGMIIPRAAMRWLGPVAAVALLGGSGIGLAQDAQVGTEMAAELVPVDSISRDLPAFQPSEEAQFEAAFNVFAEPITPALADDAVDITAIQPAEPAATPLGAGVASYYGRRFHGRRTASGEAFDMNDYTAAHKTLPFGSRVRVTNPRTGESVVVRINDRGPFVRGRDIDLSRSAAEEISIVRAGHGRVELELLD